jgi:hypothetical protein
MPMGLPARLHWPAGMSGVQRTRSDGGAGASANRAWTILAAGPSWFSSRPDVFAAARCVTMRRMGAGEGDEVPVEGDPQP